MLPARIAVITALCVCARAQGTNAKASASEYAAHAEMKDASLGAENLGHSILTRRDAILVRDFLVVEVALYPKDPRMRIHWEQFRLRVNGKKETLFPQPLGMVIASLKYPDWTTHPNLEAGAGIGDAGVIIGRPTPVPRFPGDNRGGSTPVPAQSPGNDVEKSQPEPVEDVIHHLALPEGDDVHSPASGYLFFPFSSKLKSIKTLDLIYEGPLGSATLRLP